MTPLLRKDVPIYDGNLFCWKGTKGTTEASMLERMLDCPLQPLYESTTDLGFVVKSHKSGKKKLFILEKVIYDKEDLLLWELRSGCGGITITVFND